MKGLVNSLGCLALAVAMLIPPLPAQASNNWHAVVTIRNPTASPIHYAFKWGDGSWTSCTVAPYSSRWHSWPYEYANQNSSPTPHIRFDSDLSGDLCWQEYRLQAYAAPYQSAHCGRLYTFAASWSGGYLDLKG